VRERPAGVDDRDVIAALAAWGLDASDPRYVAQGGGSYHWRVTAADRDLFVTVDDLDVKPWLGDDRGTTFASLRTAFDTALRLSDAGCSFVVAPIRSRPGTALERLSPRYSVSVFPYVEGSVGTFGSEVDEPLRSNLVRTIAELHRATPTVAGSALRREIRMPGREQLDAALSTIDEPWTAGPLSEPARRMLSAAQDAVSAWLTHYAELAHSVGRSGTPWVITHGEPHAGNVLSTRDGLRLIDWDTVALAPRERDLWMLDNGALDSFRTYSTLTGFEIDPAAIELYRLEWKLADLAAFASVLRSPHDDNADTQRALAGLETYLT
jgi:spectinomycin phosphotransferase